MELLKTSLILVSIEIYRHCCVWRILYVYIVGCTILHYGAIMLSIIQLLSISLFLQYLCG